MPFFDLTTSQQNGEKLDLMKKRIFKSFSFQQARETEGENINCGDDADTSSCC
jgi:hypothetical protein